MAKKTETKMAVVRECSFNPNEHLIDIQGLATGEIQKYLEVKYRVLWFLTYCKDNNLNGIIHEADVKYIPEAKLFTATVKIEIDGVIVGEGVSGKYFTPEDENCSPTVIQDIATSAKGRALANAGFGTAMCAFEDGEKAPCEAGIPVKNPLIPDNTEGNASPEPKRRGRPPKKEEVKAEVIKDKNLPTTLKEAQMVVYTSNGKYQGKTFGEIAALDMNYIQFLAEKYNAPSHPEYPVAARLILQG